MRRDGRVAETFCVSAPPIYVLAAGRDARRVLDECPASLVDRLDQAVLVVTDPTTATRLVSSGGGHVYVYDTEDAARSGLSLLGRASLVQWLSGRMR
jgi:hypothetical protein